VTLDGSLTLRADGVALSVDVGQGGRFSSLVVAEHEILVTHGEGPIWWGCYPMAPFAGRIGHGRFDFGARSYQLEQNLPPHAIHGTVFARPWQVVSQGPDHVEMAIDLGRGWPFAGQVRHSIAVDASGLDATLLLEADEPMPAWLGWHPWFRRRIADVEADLALSATRMYLRGPDGLPTGRLVPPPPRPWDDAFSGLLAPPRLTWPGVLALDVTSTADIWVVFDERPEGICVEPQTAPPDALGLAARGAAGLPVAEPGRPVAAEMSWRWSRPG
jgi:aldose 1-epimerase